MSIYLIKQVYLDVKNYQINRYIPMSIYLIKQVYLNVKNYQINR